MAITLDRASNYIDKSDWGDGPWQDEPDHAQWQDPSTDLVCLGVRHPSSGHWCGYVGVAEGHPAFGVPYGDADDLGEPNADGYRYLRVHGGLTFSDFCHEEDGEQGVCHVPLPGQAERVWWLGFDCCHSGDISPGMDARIRSYGMNPIRSASVWGRKDEYRTLEYVKGQCANLARQLVEVAQRCQNRSA
jgi:hypothetical protein